MRRWRLPMLLLVIGKRGNHLVRARADRAIAAEQIAIEIREPGGVRPDVPAGRQIEEQRAAAQARLEVLLELRRDESAELREQLPLAPGPFQKRARRIRSAGRTRGRSREGGDQR